MRRRPVRKLRSLGVIAAALASLLAACSEMPARHTPIAKVDSRLAQTARRADALGLTPLATLSLAPSRRGQLLRALAEGPPSSSSGAAVEEAAVETAPARAAGVSEAEAAAEAMPSPDRLWLRRYLESYAADVADVWAESEKDSTFFQPLDDARVRFIYVDERVRFYNEQGRDFEKGANFYISDRAAARLWNRVLITAEPEFSVVENKPSHPDEEAINLRFQELAASVRLGFLEVTAGRTPLWWGPGRHGNLILSNNVRPFDLVKLSSAYPILLPWYFRHLGLIRGEIFATQLENARPVPRPYMAGFRVTSRLCPWLEVGASRTAQFGGKGRSVTWETIWEVITASTENDPDDPGNQIAAIDLRLIIPWPAQPFEVYGELGGEDEAGGWFSREAYLAGIYLPRIGPWSGLELNIEFTDTVVDGHPRTWYTNRNFPGEGYTYHNRIIGHHVGTDGRDYFAELRVRLPCIEERRPSIALSYDFEQHFHLDPVEERLHQFRISFEFDLWRRLRASAFYEEDYWNNQDQVRGRSDSGRALGVGASWDF
jgi:hypothetical protein